MTKRGLRGKIFIGAASLHLSSPKGRVEAGGIHRIKSGKLPMDG